MLHLVGAVALVEAKIDQGVVSGGELVDQRRRVSEFDRIECGRERAARCFFETGEAGAEVPRSGRVNYRRPLERHLPSAIAALGPLRFRWTGRTEAVLPVSMLVGDRKSAGKAVLL